MKNAGIASLSVGSGLQLLTWLLDKLGKKMPNELVLALLIFGALLIVWPIAYAIWTWRDNIVRIRFRWPMLLSGQVRLPDGSYVDPTIVARAEGRFTQWQKELEQLPKLVRSDINSVILRYLWDGQDGPNDEPYIALQFDVENNTNHTILLTGVEGQMVINDLLCTSSPKWPGGGDRFPPFHPAGVNITQPLSAERGRTLLRMIESGEAIPFNLGNVCLTGIIEDADQRPIKIRAAQAFQVDGAGITKENSQARIQPPRLAKT